MATEMQNAYKDADGALRLMQEIQIMDEDITNKGGMLKGRQYTKLILEHFRTDRSLDKAWQMEDLYALEYPGDAKLQQFRFIWHKIVHCLQGEVSTDQLRKLLRRRLENSKALKEDIAHYDRQVGVADSKDHSYEYLLDSMDRYLCRSGIQQNQLEHEKMFEQQMKALKEGKNLTPAQVMQQMNVTPTEVAKWNGNGGGKGAKGKGKGKDGKGNGQGAPCWFHNARHHYPDWGHCCMSKMDETAGKTTCRYPHTIMSRKDFDALPPPRSVAKGGGKGGGSGNTPKRSGVEKGALPRGADEERDRRKEARSSVSSSQRRVVATKPRSVPSAMCRQWRRRRWDYPCRTTKRLRRTRWPPRRRRPWAQQ